MDQDAQEQDQNKTELTNLEKELCKQNFAFYDRNRVGSVERFELAMLLNGTHPLRITHFFLACGYYLDDKRLQQLNQYLDEKKA